MAPETPLNQYPTNSGAIARLTVCDVCRANIQIHKARLSYSNKIYDIDYAHYRIPARCENTSGNYGESPKLGKVSGASAETHLRSRDDYVQVKCERRRLSILY